MTSDQCCKAESMDKLLILFYDGDCGLCTHSVKFFLKADKKKRLKFAPLQGATAMKYLPADLRNPEALSTVVYMRMPEQDAEPEILTRSLAVARVLKDVGGLWCIIGGAIRITPEFIREPAYRFIAKHRLKFFPSGACALPTPDERSRLLD